MRKLNPKIIFLFVFIVALAVYFFPKKTATTDSNTPQAIDTYGAVPQEDNGVQSSEPKTTQTASGAVTGAPQTQPLSEAEQKLQVFIATEAKNLDQPHVDTKQKDLELKKRVENFSEDEKKLVLITAHDTHKAANERILAAYMLVLDQSQSSLENLNQLASKALPDFGSVTAHSEAEIRRGQELAVRYMAVDELAKRALNDPQALETLKGLANSGESAEIRGYAQRVLKQIK